MAPSTPVYLVHAQGDPLVVKIQGRAHFRNAAPLDEALLRFIEDGARHFVLDFHACESIDSTVLGILAGVGLALHDADPPGRMVLAGLDTRMRGLLENVGLQHIAELCGRDCVPVAPGTFQPLSEQGQSSLEAARLVLRAHEDLIKTDPTNAGQFQDVVDLVRDEIRDRLT